ncbi:hypothetical protein V8E36_002913 [Tilletia maclaganii]
MPSDSNATCATVMLAADQTSVRTASQSTAVTLTPLSSTSDDLPGRPRWSWPWEMLITVRLEYSQSLK